MTDKSSQDDQLIDVKNLDPSSSAPEASSVRLVMTLALAGLISGLAIIGIYEVTFSTIAANKARELKEAVFKVLPDVKRMQKLVMLDGKLTATMDVVKDEKPVYAGYGENDQFIGYAIPAEGPGFQDVIKLLYGYLPSSRLVVGMEVLDSLETPGLGDKIYKDLSFVANFDALVVDPQIVTVKKGKKTAANEVDAITGATISSKAVVRIINESNGVWLSNLLDVAPPLPVTVEQTSATED